MLGDGSDQNCLELMYSVYACLSADSACLYISPYHLSIYGLFVFFFWQTTYLWFSIKKDWMPSWRMIINEDWGITMTLYVLWFNLVLGLKVSSFHYLFFDFPPSFSCGNSSRFWISTMDSLVLWLDILKRERVLQTEQVNGHLQCTFSIFVA